MGRGDGSWLERLGDRVGLAATYAAARELRLLVVSTEQASALDRRATARAVALGNTHEAGKLYQLLCESWAARGAFDRRLAVGRVVEHFRAAVPLLTPDEHLSLASTCGERATKLAIHGEFDGAETLFNELIDLSRSRRDDHPFIYRYILGGALSNLGTALTQQRRFAEAIKALDEALDLRRELTKRRDFPPALAHGDLADTLSNLGNLHAVRRALTEAEDFLRQAVALQRDMVDAAAQGKGAPPSVRAIDPRQHLDRRRLDDRLAGSLASLGNALSLQEQFDQAATALGESVEIRRQLVRSPLGIMVRPGLGVLLVNLGNVRFEQRRYREAEEAYREALALFERLPSFARNFYRPDIATTLHVLGRVLWRQRRGIEAEACMSRGVAIMREVLTGSPAYADELGALLSYYGQLLRDMGRTEEAESALREAIERDPLNLQSGRSRALAGLARLQTTSEQAYSYWHEALTLLDGQRTTLRQRDDRRSFQREYQEIYAAMIDCCLDVGRDMEAWQWAERARGRSLLDVLGSIRPPLDNPGDKAIYAAWKSAHDEAIEAEERLYRARSPAAPGQDAPDQGDIERLHTRIAEARAEEGDRYRQMVLRLDKSRPLLEVAIPEPADLRAHLRELTRAATSDATKGTLVVEYALLSQAEASDGEGAADRYAVFLVSLASGMDAVEATRVRLAAGALQRVVDAFVSARDAPDRPAETLQDAWAVLPGMLGSVLLQPWQDALDRHKPAAIFLIAHGVLHALPLHIAEDRQGQLLIERCPVAWLPNATLAEVLVQRQARSARPNGRIVLGPPTDSQLQFARLEALSLARNWGLIPPPYARPPYADERMTIAALRENIGKIALLHLATHARFDASDYQRSYIQFQHEQLALAELISDPTLDLSGVRLCYLSSCESARIIPHAGDELPGLVWAFIYAGAEAVLASLWKADDKAAHYLSDVLYGSWQGQTTLAEAYREAILAAREEFVLPYFWAPFILTGNVFILLPE